MKGLQTSPRILSSSWGRLEIETLGRGKDFKLWPGGGRAWDWSEHGTAHTRGIQIGDVEEVIEKGAEVVILTKGVLSRLRVPRATRFHVEKQGVQLIVASTKKAVGLYNEYVDKGVPVGGLFHSTC
jgi:hypothetical protein